MGLDLTLLPIDHFNESLSFSHTVLRTYGGYDLFELLETVDQLPVPANFKSYLSRDDEYEATHYGTTTQDPYGEHINYTTVGKLLAAVEKRSSPWAPSTVMAFLEAMKPDSKIALFWH